VYHLFRCEDQKREQGRERIMNDILKIVIGILLAGIFAVGGFLLLAYIAHLTT